MRAKGIDILWLAPYIVLTFSLLCTLKSSAQVVVPTDTIPPTELTITEADTPEIITPASEEQRLEEVGGVKSHKPYDLIPKRAVLFSIIPGGGQIYNRQYWKLPIIVGAYTACYYAISWNNNNLIEYTNAFRDIKSDRPLDHDTWQDFLPYGASPESYVNNVQFHDQLRRGRDFYRRYRDLSIIITAAVYLLVMVDAYVDAELYSFDITPDLTLSAQPTLLPPTIASPHTGYGVSLALNF